MDFFEEVDESYGIEEDQLGATEEETVTLSLINFQLSPRDTLHLHIDLYEQVVAFIQQH